MMKLAGVMLPKAHFFMKALLLPLTLGLAGLPPSPTEARILTKWYHPLDKNFSRGGGKSLGQELCAGGMMKDIQG